MEKRLILNPTMTCYAKAYIQTKAARHEPGEESGTDTAGHISGPCPLEQLLVSGETGFIHSYSLYNLSGSKAVLLR